MSGCFGHFTKWAVVFLIIFVLFILFQEREEREERVYGGPVGTN